VPQSPFWLNNMVDVQVNLGDRSYVIHIGNGLLRDIGQVVCGRRKPTVAAVVSNSVVFRHYGEIVAGSLRLQGVRVEQVILPAGERSKTLASVRRVYDALAQMQMDRKGALIALGGGVVGDIAGFAAATYMRGVDFFQVPTTLLAQVDASVGGKTGVDLPQGKNLVGAFYQPGAVVVDINTLRTLPGRELRCGLAEVAKHGIISDQDLFRFALDNSRRLLLRDCLALEHVIRRSAEIKRNVVQADERESGVRAILNCGHTVGHAIETLVGYGRIRHGEAVAIGLVTESILAERLMIAPCGTARAVIDILTALGLPSEFPSGLDASEAVEAMLLDKKSVGGRLNLALPTGIGECRVIGDVGQDALLGAIAAHKAGSW